VELGQRAGYAIENARLYRQAQDANRAKDEFLATLSHELRTPMTATLGWATMLRLGETSGDNFHLALDTIERSTRAQAKLIDEILDVSRIVTGKLQLNIAPVNLQNVIEAAVDAVRPSIAAKGISLQLDFARVDGVPTGDAERLQQVIWNLLSNSVKFTPSGGSIAIHVDQPQRDTVRVSVTDTGQGITRKLLPLIFERFRQGDSSSTRTHGGLGLGLAIVKNIVELHGGSVSAASDGEGRGATFTIALPLAKGPAMATAATHAEAVPLSLAGVSVLLVEDDDDTRRMLAAALQNFGASVVAVGSANAALDALRNGAPNVVVSDIAMPDEDGYTLMMKIRSGAVERAQNVPAVALTAYARAEDRERILASGFGFHLTKPVDPVAMVRVIRQAARG
jgi:CheY-like chemotaxis protein